MNEDYLVKIKTVACCIKSVDKGKIGIKKEHNFKVYRKNFPKIRIPLLICNKIEKATQILPCMSLYSISLASCWFESVVSIDEFLFKEVTFCLRMYSYVLNVKICTFWCYYLSLGFELFCSKIFPGFYILIEGVMWGPKTVFLPYNLPYGTSYWISFCNASFCGGPMLASRFLFQRLW